MSESHGPEPPPCHSSPEDSISADGPLHTCMPAPLGPHHQGGQASLPIVAQPEGKAGHSLRIVLSAFLDRLGLDAGSSFGKASQAGLPLESEIKRSILVKAGKKDGLPILVHFIYLQLFCISALLSYLCKGSSRVRLSPSIEDILCFFLF